MSDQYSRGYSDGKNGRRYRPPHDDLVSLALQSERQREERKAYKAGFKAGEEDAKRGG